MADRGDYILWLLGMLDRQVLGYLGLMYNANALFGSRTHTNSLPIAQGKLLKES